MTIFILLILSLLGFAVYRIYCYKKQREIEEMATDAQAYVSAEIVELLQKSKTIMIQNSNIITPEIEEIQKKLRHLSEYMVCHTDSEASVREYLTAARQELAVIQNQLDKTLTGNSSAVVSTTPDQNPENEAFDALK